MTRWPREVEVARGAEGAVVMVGHSDCETSRLMLRALERLHRRRTRDVAVSALLQDEPEDARALAAEYGLTLPILLDRDPYPLTTRLGVSTVPVTFVLAPDGAVRRSLQAFRREEVERMAAELGAAAPVFDAAEGVPALRPG
jgi:peroxiredoxin